MSWKHLFQRSIAADPDRLHMAAHSHHLWPDASWLGHQAAWEDAARLADRKWDRVMGDIWPAAQHHVAEELGLTDPASIVFATNTHDFILRLASAIEHRPLRILTSDGEFHSFRRQAARWVEAGHATVETIACEPAEDFGERFLAAAQAGEHDLIFVSQVFFGTGRVNERFAKLASIASPEGPLIVIDGYHGFMAIETDLAPVGDRLFYLAGGYKYAMAGEGVALLHAPPGFGARPVATGWYAEFADLAATPGNVGYAGDARRFMGATFDPSGLYRFVAVREMLAREGLTTATINTHVAGLMNQLVERLGDTPLAGAALLNPCGQGAHARFLAFRSDAAPMWHAALMAQGVVTDVRGDVLRIGFGLYHDMKDIDRLIEHLTALHDRGA